MIDWLRGRVVRVIPGTTQLVLDVNGVGYGVEVAVADAREIAPPGEILELHITTVMSESSIRLFGFLEAAGKDLFEVVTSVSGIGPKLGLALLSALGSAGLVRAILSNDLRSLKGVSGVGAKTAERLVLELKDKVGRFSSLETIGQSTPQPPTGPGAPEADVIHALISMGVKPITAERAATLAREALGDQAGFQELMKEALRYRK